MNPGHSFRSPEKPARKPIRIRGRVRQGIPRKSEGRNPVRGPRGPKTLRRRVAKGPEGVEKGGGDRQKAHRRGRKPRRECRNRFHEERKHPQRAENPSEGGSKRHTACPQGGLRLTKPPKMAPNRAMPGPRVSKPTGTGDETQFTPIPDPLFSMNRKKQRRHCRNRKSCRKTALLIPRTSVTATRTTTATRTNRTQTPARRTITRSMTIA